jgi:hypothetical protein
VPLALLASACSPRTSHNEKEQEQKRPVAPAQNSDPSTALSLASLQKHLREERKSKSATLPGINRVTGFVVEGSDVILHGWQDQAIPPIELEVLVIALRNAFAVGNEYKGDPGCSIDPIPGEDPFRVQKVRVIGVPKDCVMAARHVRLDYELKRAGAGIPEPDGKILPSAFELADSDGPCVASGDREVSMAHRYWFYPITPERPRFTRDGQTVSILRPVGVQVLTEQEFMNGRGERTGATTADPGAQKFSGAVTALLASDKVPRYSQMVHDFRAIELARLMHFCGVQPIDLSFLINEFELARVEVPSLVGGVRRVEEGEAVCNATVTQTAEGTHYVERSNRYRYEYRGGVEAKVEIAEPDFRAGSLDILRRRIIASRPSPEVVFWRIN